MTTFMPASVKARAMPRPMPLSPPVMKATLPSTSRIGVGTDAQFAGAAAATGRPAGTSAAAAVAAVASAALPKNPRRACPPGVSASPLDGLSLFWLMRDSLIVGANLNTALPAGQSRPGIPGGEVMSARHSPLTGLIGDDQS